MTYSEQGQTALRAENIQSAVRGIALANLVIRENACRIENTDSWTNSFYSETNKTLNSKQGIARGADFPQDNLSWEKASVDLQKFGLENTLFYEDINTDNIRDMVGRAVARIGNAIANQIDTHVWNTLSENKTPVNIRSTTLTTNFEWDSSTLASRRPHEDLAVAMGTMINSNVQQYVPDMLLVNPVDASYLLSNDSIIATYTPNKALDITQGGSGVIGNIFPGIKVVCSPVVTTDYALLLKSKVAARYVQLDDISTTKIEDPGKSVTIRGWAAGACQLTDPKAIMLIINTRK